MKLPFEPSVCRSVGRSVCSEKASRELIVILHKPMYINTYGQTTKGLVEVASRLKEIVEI